MERKWPGTPLTAADIAERRVATAEWRPEAKYAWSAGESIGRFLEELKEGHLVGRKCDTCDKVYFPPRSFCQEDFVRAGGFVRLKNTGKVETYSISYLDTDARRLEEPVYVGVISIDGASEGMGIMHFLGEVEEKKLIIGMRVRAVWKPKKEREGSVTDIRYFKPV
ncbi:MAG: Zn-ribbon domain-containing OB-fold protein [Thermoplasmata archaeon]